jgi:hypothetical protein
MARIRTREFTVFVGKAGFGKTTAIKEFIKRVPDDRLYVYDYNGIDYPGHPYRWLPAQQTESDFHRFLNIAYVKGNVLIVLEEADAYLDDSDRTQTRFFRTARNRGVGCLISSKRIKDSIRPRFRTRINRYFIFHTDLPEDIRYLEELCGEPKGSFDKIQHLKVGEFFEYDMNTHKMSGKQKVPLKVKRVKVEKPEQKEKGNVEPSAVASPEATEPPLVSETSHVSSGKKKLGIDK